MESVKIDPPFLLSSDASLIMVSESLCMLVHTITDVFEQSSYASAGEN